jgi:hypothetical protein
LKRSTDVEVAMRKLREAETSEQRERRLTREIQMKRDTAEANDAAVDRMIRQNLAQYGP